MSEKEVVRFAAMALKNQALMDRLLKDSPNAQAFARNAVAAGKESGYSFSEDEAAAWYERELRHKAGELSERELEAVAGGKNGRRAGRG